MMCIQYRSIHICLDTSVYIPIYIHVSTCVQFLVCVTKNE